MKINVHSLARLEAKRRVRKHYALSRPVTDAELDAEVISLRRKHANGSLCDHALGLYCAIEPYIKEVQS